MSFTDNINEDLKQAMKSKDEAALRALRAIKSALLLAKTEKGGGDEIDDEQGVRILQKLAKQRKESIEIFRQQGRAELATAEEQELSVIEKYLPKQMSEADVKAVISRIINETGAKGASDISKVMPVAMKELAGKAEGKTISAIAKELLS